MYNDLAGLRDMMKDLMGTLEDAEKYIRRVLDGDLWSGSWIRDNFIIDPLP